MWWLVAVAYLLWDIWAHGPLFRNIVSLFSLFFATHRNIGSFLGIQYFRSDTWETSRSETTLQFPTFGAFWLVGINYEIGRDEHIRALKTRQTSHTRDIDLSQHIQILVGRHLSIVEIEDFLIRAWLSELIDVYSITPPNDVDAYVRGIKAMRAFSLSDEHIYSVL